MGPVAVVGAICPVFASFGVTMIRKLKRGLYRSLVLAALLVGFCQAGQAQEAPGGAPSAYFHRRRGHAISERPHLRR